MRRRSALPLLASLLLLGACRDAKVTTYQAPKDPPEAMTAGPGPATAAPGATDMASTAVPTAAGADLIWTAPAGWKPKPAAAMRKGSYAVPGADGAEADLSITAFPGDVGGELANVNRWRGQIQLPPLDEAGLAAATTRVSANGLEFVVVDFANPSASKPTRILGAMGPFNGATWFFKLNGPDALVAAAKPEFLAFLKTVRPPALP
jgi:hypothetical protein